MYVVITNGLNIYTPVFIQIKKNMLDSGLVKKRTQIREMHLTLSRLEVPEKINYCVDFVRKTALTTRWFTTSTQFDLH